MDAKTDFSPQPEEKEKPRNRWLDSDKELNSLITIS